MGIDFTSSAMIESIKTRALVPTSQKLFGNDLIVKIITEELLADIVPLIMDVREEYFVNYFDQAINTAVSNYDLPSRAVGQKLRDVVLLNTQNREVSLPRLEADQLKHQWFLGNYSLYMNRRGFYFQDGYVTLFPDATSLGAYRLRMKYFRRPNNVCQTTAAGQVIIIDFLNNIVTLNNVPATWLVTDTFDIIRGKPGFKSLGDDLTITAVDPILQTVTFAALPTDLAVGDWVCPSGFSPIPQIPYEVFNILEQRCTIKLLEDMKDSEGLKNAAEVYTNMVDRFRTLVSPRADGSPKRIVRSSTLFGDRRYRGNWW
jgi:hypothetical protein